MLFLYLWVSMEQVDRSSARETPKKRRSSGMRKSQYDVRSVDEITEDDLENIAYRSKDKIWDKENVSDPSPPPPVVVVPGLGGSLTVFVTFPSGQLVPPVPTEDSGH